MINKKIGLKVDVLDYGISGIGNYTYNLSSTLLKIDHKNDYALIHSKKSLSEDYGHIFNAANEITVEPLFPLKNRYICAIDKILMERLKYFKIIKEAKFTLIHEFDPFYVIPLDKKKTIVTLYDLPGLYTPTFLGRLYNAVLLHSLKNLSKKEDTYFISISHSTKTDALRYLNIPSEKISVVHPGVNDKIFKPLKEAEYTNHPFILFAGANIPRKNIATLIKAFKILKKGEVPHKLILVTSPNKSLQEMIVDLDLRNEVIVKSNLPVDALVKLYNSAELFVSPSLYEGFGLPPLEAMACGCPVITSNAASLPEVVGDAGLMVDPYDVNGLSNAMEEVLSNNGLREDMIKKGLERAEMFSWEKAATETLKVYEAVMAK